MRLIDSRMAASKPGGRPKNAWNSSRRRKLVRLYTLTHLSTVEIGNVLKADDFNPCLRDIQARLKDLLPSDYAKRGYQYRPKDGSSSKTRLKRLQQHRQAQKSRASLLKKDEQTSLSTPGQQTQPWTDPYHLFEGPLSAFRNYAESGTPTENLTQLSLYARSPESQPVNPSLLLLDGSSITGTAIIPCHQDQKQEQPVDGKTLPTSSQGQSQALVRQVSGSSLVSLSNLQARLSRRSSSMIRHVHSVLSFSSTNSWRSSVSWRSSWISFGSQSTETSATEVFTHHEDLEQSRHNPKAPSELYSFRAPPYRERPKHVMTYGVFDCTHPDRSRKLQDSNLCRDCGLQAVHRYFEEPRGHEIPRSMCSKDIQKKDYFDNGPLHFAAYFGSATPWLLLCMIDMGADFHLMNTCGATFLHILFRCLKTDQILDYLPLLRRLSVLNFSFLSRDHWGRQPVHVLLKRFRYSSLDTIDKLEEAFAVMNPDFDALDVKGRSARTLMSRRFGRAKSEARVSEFLSRFPTSRNSTIKFADVLREMDGDWTAWMEWVSIEGRSAWVDSNGETALIALLKYWDHDRGEGFSPDIVKDMVGLGSQIEMRDRNGDTALAVATKRGLCLAVKSLIELQASIHATNNRGDGILRSARTEMRLAKKNGQDKLYAMILNCIICLIDLEAWEIPSVRREFWAKWAPDPHCEWERREPEANITQTLEKIGFL